jgi:hypothetical protein
VSRRPPLPGAAELFRSTITPPTQASVPPRSHTAPVVPRVGSGRQKHDSKITVYVSAEELIALEQARLSLRAQHGMSVDRGRIVREAVAVLLADFDEHGENSMLVRRLRGGRG